MPTPKDKTQPRKSQSHHKAETEALFASIGEALIATDDAGNITRANQAAATILGYTLEELLGSWLPKLVVATYDDGTAIDMMDRPVSKAIVSGKTVSARTSYRRKDGSLVPVALTVSPIMQGGRPIGTIEIFRDISLDIKSEKMKTEFISVASHQLRTPLSAINVYTRMLSDGMAGELNKEQARFTESILASVDRMNTLINTLLNITRIEAGGINVKISKVSLQDLAKSIVDEATPSAQEKGLSVRNQFRPVGPIDTDPLLVKEVMVNILSNAIKYTPTGGTITVGLREDAGNIVFNVRDTGFGIPLAAQEHIFTKFFRADNILHEDVSGTGLGLYLIKTIAESLNGELWFESTEGKGSVFYFALSKQGSVARHGKFKLD